MGLANSDISDLISSYSHSLPVHLHLQEVMGLANSDISDLSSTNNNPALSLPKLRSDSSNWATYSERVLNYLTSKGYCRHVLGTACKPEELVKCDGKYYRPASTIVVESKDPGNTGKDPEPLKPLTDEELEKHEDAVDLYIQLQAAV